MASGALAAMVMSTLSNQFWIIPSMNSGSFIVAVGFGAGAAMAFRCGGGDGGGDGFGEPGGVWYGENGGGGVGGGDGCGDGSDDGDDDGSWRRRWGEVEVEDGVDVDWVEVELEVGFVGWAGVTGSVRGGELGGWIGCRLVDDDATLRRPRAAGYDSDRRLGGSWRRRGSRLVDVDGVGLIGATVYVDGGER